MQLKIWMCFHYRRIYFRKNIDFSMQNMEIFLTVLFFCIFGFSTENPINNTFNAPVKDPPIIAKTFADVLTLNAKNDFYEGDIVFQQTHQRNAIADKTERWDQTIPYEISAEFSFEKKTIIFTALNELEVRSCFKFVERSNEADYLSYVVGNGCYSNVGRSGGMQTVSIGSGCEYHRTVIHETLHALGFWHEQSRTDRDDYVTIVWDVITDGSEYNFDKYDSDKLDTQGVPYDYDSIMHYHDTAFSKNGSKTIIAPADKTETMGKMDAMSKIDVNELNLLYECQSDIDVDGFTQWSDWSPCDQVCKKERQRFCDGGQCSAWGEVQTESAPCDSSCEVGRDPDCGEKSIAGETGSIQSPLFPFSYKSNAECVQTITTPQGSRVRLEFQVFGVEDYNGDCYYDFVHIYDGPSDTSPQIGTHCGQELPPSTLSSGNTLTIKFKSDYSVVKEGFYANYYAVFGSFHACNFDDETDFCGWTHNNSVELTFQSNKGTTGSVETGPPADHTFGDNFGRYLYLESSTPAENGNRARIVSPLFYPISNEFCFSFWYSMYGINIGSLSLYKILDDSSTPISLLTISGDKGNDDWYLASVGVSGPTSFKLAIEAVRGNGYKGDIGIDDVRLDIGSCP